VLTGDLLDDVLESTEEVIDGDGPSPGDVPLPGQSPAIATAPAADAGPVPAPAPSGTPFASSPIAPGVTPPIAPVDDQLDALFNGLTPAQAQARSAADLQGAPALTQEVTPGESEKSPVGALAPSPAATPAPGAEEVAAVLDPEAYPDTSLPLLLRPLEWINAPFNALPEAVREALGKVALVTLFNAIAVLVYVLVFRKHS
jgi:hypothetical protein